MVMKKRKYDEKELFELFDGNEDDIIEFLATDGGSIEEEEWPDRYYDEYYDDY